LKELKKKFFSSFFRLFSRNPYSYPSAAKGLPTALRDSRVKVLFATFARKGAEPQSFSDESSLRYFFSKRSLSASAPLRENLA
jgi:hypothetical protein